MKVSIGVFAHNEGSTIGFLLQRLNEQKTDTVDIAEIIVVSSGSTDSTNKIVRNFARKNKNINLFTQQQRLGKASAVNIFLKAAKSDICLFVNADALPKKDTIEKLCNKFSDSKIGMTGGRVIPLTHKNSILGFTNHLLWQLHHEISLKYPKMGEMVAFRKIFTQIDEKTAVDEAYIEPLIQKQKH